MILAATKHTDSTTGFPRVSGGDPNVEHADVTDAHVFPA